MTKEQLEGFVNYKGFTSGSAYLVWVDIDRQLTYVFYRLREIGSIINYSMLNWENESPTIRGTFTVSRRGELVL
jgi:hypothetical protein